MPRYESKRDSSDAASLLAEGLKRAGAKNVGYKGSTVYYTADDDHAQRLLNAGYDAAVYKSVPSSFWW